MNLCDQWANRVFNKICRQHAVEAQKCSNLETSCITVHMKLDSSAICFRLISWCPKYNNKDSQADFVSVWNWQVVVYSQPPRWQSEVDTGANDGPLVYLWPVGAPPLGSAGSLWTRTCSHTDLRVAVQHRSSNPVSPTKAMRLCLFSSSLRAECVLNLHQLKLMSV